MGECVNCGRALDPHWKFCIYCGTAVPAADGETRPEIPSAIRPPTFEGTVAEADFDAEPDPRQKRRIDVPLIIGIALGIAGVTLIIYMVVVLNATS